MVDFSLIDNLAGQFQRDFNTAACRIEDVLNQALDDATRRELFLELLTIEASILRKQGKIPAWLNYRERFPHYIDIIILVECSQGGTDADLIRARFDTGFKHSDFLLESRLGEGGMGQVWKAKQLSLDRFVVIKFISPHARSPVNGRELTIRFNREAKAFAKLNSHPNIATVLGIGQTPDRGPFIAMEYIDGDDLSREIARGPMPIERAVSFAITLARAVHYAHQQGVIHRDLKPQNILLSKHDTLKIIDFGLSTINDDGEPSLTQSDQTIGTPQYMAPEQANRSSPIDTPSVDIYALGGILYAMLTGHHPYAKESNLKILTRLALGAPLTPLAAIRSDITPELEFICFKCLRRLPVERFESAGQIADELGHLLSPSKLLSSDRSRSVLNARPTELTILESLVLLSRHDITGECESAYELGLTFCAAALTDLWLRGAISESGSNFEIHPSRFTGYDLLDRHLWLLERTLRDRDFKSTLGTVLDMLIISHELGDETLTNLVERGALKREARPRRLFFERHVFPLGDSGHKHRLLDLLRSTISSAPETPELTTCALFILLDFCGLGKLISQYIGGQNAFKVTLDHIATNVPKLNWLRTELPKAAAHLQAERSSSSDQCTVS
jgi:serine/threonine protein kinase